MNMNNLVCRTCLGIISEGKVAHNVDDENGLIRNVRNIREMIMFCVPEMDMFVSVGPVICESCLGILVSVYNFKIRCLRVENAVRSYITSNNVMDGSCVNLNNVVRQQIVEALKQKQWPPNLINEYVDKHLCVLKSPQPRPTLRLFQSMTQNFHAPRALNSTGPRPPAPNALEIPPLATMGGNITPSVASTNSLPPPYEGPHEGNLRPPVQASRTAGYLVVSKNLMPSSGNEENSLSQQFRNSDSINSLPVNTVNSLSPAVPDVTGSVVQPASVQYPVLQLPGTTPTPPTVVGDMQTFFLNALQLTSAATGGREEAVLLNKKELKKRTSRKSNPRPSQNYIPLKTGSRGSFLSLSPKESLVNINGNSTGPLVLCPTTGLLQSVPVNQEGGSKETCLRSVRKNMNMSGGKIISPSSVRGKDDDIIILDDDVDMGTQKVEEETLLMNFDENVEAPVDAEVSDIPASTTEPPPVNTTQFNKKIIVKLPMIDKETMKRKLTPEDVIDEIISKRRKLVVKLSNRLTYLHKNKRLIVKVPRERFFFCMFCKFVVTEGKKLRNHYKSRHKVCSICNYKSNKASSLTNHINQEHISELVSALKLCVGDKMVYHCYLCEFSGLSDFDLRDHRLRIHVKCNINGMYQCPYLTCNVEYPIAYSIAKHIQTYHDKLRLTQCPLCNYSAASSYGLKKHIETHTKTKLKCHLCSFGCKTSFSLKIHMKKQHPVSQLVNTTGMFYDSNLTGHNENTSYNEEDYRITLDSLQSCTKELQSTIPSNTSTNSDPNKDLFEHVLPSFGEILCNQNFTEEPSDQEDDCTIVSEPLTRPRGRPRKPPCKHIKKPTKKKKKISETMDGGSIDDPDDCMIVAQEIPTVDLSDDEEVASTGENHDDCFVISDDLPVAAESSTQRVDNTAALEPEVDSETDTCSEAFVSQKKISPKSTGGSVSETDTSLLAGDILNCKTGSEANKKTDKEGSISQNITSQDDPFSEEDGVTSLGTLEGNKVVEDPVTQKPKTSDSLTEENIQGSQLESFVGIAAVLIDDVGTSKASQLTTDKSKGGSSESMAHDTVSDPLELCKEPRASNKRNTSKIFKRTRGVDIKETLEATETLLQLLDDHSSDSSTNSEPKTPQESREVRPVSESFLIESSDEDSNDCTFVSESNAQENASGSEDADGSDRAKESEESDVQCNPQTVIGETSIENDVVTLVESQKKLKNNTSDNFSTHEETSAGSSKTSAENSEIDNKISGEGIEESNNEHIPDSDDTLLISASELERTSDVDVNKQSSELLESSLKTSVANKNDSCNLEKIPSSEISQKAATVVKDVLEIVDTDIEMEIEDNKTSESTQDKAVTEKMNEENSSMETDALAKSTVEKNAGYFNIETSESTQNKADTVTSIEEIIMESNSPSKSTVDDSADNLNIEISEPTQNKADTGKSIEENCIMESDSPSKSTVDDSANNLNIEISQPTQNKADTGKNIEENIMESDSPSKSTVDDSADNLNIEISQPTQNKADTGKNIEENIMESDDLSKSTVDESADNLNIEISESTQNKADTEKNIEENFIMESDNQSKNADHLNIDISEYTQNKADKGKSIDENFIMESDDPSKSTVQKSEDNLSIEIPESTQNKTDTEKSIKENVFMESDGPSKSTVEESADNLNIEISESTQNKADTGKSIKENFIMESDGASKITVEDNLKIETSDPKITQESEVVDLDLGSTEMGAKDLDIVLGNTKKTDVNMPVEAQNLLDILKDTILDVLQPVAKCSGITKDNLIQVACADSTVSDFVSESDNVSSDLFEPAKNTLDSGCDKNIEENITVDLGKVMSSDVIESEEKSTYLDCEENIDQCNTEAVAQEHEKATLILNSNVDSRGESISAGSNIVSKASESDTLVNIDLGLQTTKD